MEFGRETVNILNEICAASRLSSARELPYMMAASERGREFMEKPAYILKGRLSKFYSMNQIQMRTMGGRGQEI